MRDDKAQLDAADAVVFGMNPASLSSHDKFSTKYNFPFALLVDQDRAVAHAYDALKENGKSIQRTVYVVDKDGKIAFAQEGIPPDSDILAAITG